MPNRFAVSNYTFTTLHESIGKLTKLKNIYIYILRLGETGAGEYQWRMKEKAVIRMSLLNSQNNWQNAKPTKEEKKM